MATAADLLSGMVDGVDSSDEVSPSTSNGFQPSIPQPRISIPTEEKLSILRAIRDRRDVLLNKSASAEQRATAWDEVYEEYSRNSPFPIPTIDATYIRNEVYKTARRRAFERLEKGRLCDADYIIFDIVGHDWTAEKKENNPEEQRNGKKRKRSPDDISPDTSTTNSRHSKRSSKLMRPRKPFPKTPLIPPKTEPMDLATATAAAIAASATNSHDEALDDYNTSMATMTANVTENSTPLTFNNSTRQLPQTGQKETSSTRSVDHLHRMQALHLEGQFIANMFASRIWPTFEANGERSYRRMTEEEYENGVINVPAKLDLYFP